MILYLAGNFPALRNPSVEKLNKELAESKGYEYNRLVSYFFEEDCLTIFKMKGGGDEDRD